MLPSSIPLHRENRGSATVELALPEEFVRNTIGVHGEAGERWLARLPNLIAESTARWHLVVGGLPPFPLSYNYVVPVIHTDMKGQEVAAVLKLGVPSAGLLREIEALRIFGGRGSARLIDSDPDRGTLLIERLAPGLTLDAVLCDDEAAATAAAVVMRALWQPHRSAAHGCDFPTLSDWAAGLGRTRSRFGGGTGPIPAQIFHRAEGLANDLLGSSAVPSMLLHGDLHHGNILSSDRAPFLAIDPQGVLGDPAFEPSAFLLNPVPVSAKRLARRVAVFAEVLGLDRERIHAWGMVRAVLSACWTIEDNGHDCSGAVTVAERLAELLVTG